MDNKKKGVGIFIAAILVASVFSVLIGNVGANVDAVDPMASKTTGPAGAGGIAPMNG